MGKVISFYSPRANGDEGTAAFCAMTAMMAGVIPGRIACAELYYDQYGANALLFGRGKANAQWNYGKCGMEALLYNFKKAVLNEERVEKCGIPLKEARDIVLFPGLRSETVNEEKEELLSFLISKKLPEIYDWTMTSISKKQTEATEKIMKETNVMIVIMPQDPCFWDYYFHNAKQHSAPNKKTLYLIANYKEKSKYNKRYFLWKYASYLRGNELGILPFPVGFYDAIYDGALMDYVRKNEFAGRREENYNFISEARKAVLAMVRIANH